MSEIRPGSDGWIRMSSFMAGNIRGMTLAEVIGAADDSKHGIPTTQELSSDLAKLKPYRVINIDYSVYQI